MDAIRECERRLRESGSTFATAFMLLPRDERAALTAFYAYCREVDDAADEGGGGGPAIQEWRRRVADIYMGRPDDHPVAEALRWATGRFPIERSHLELVLDGVESDLDGQNIETFSDLYRYCYRVASSVGLVLVTVLGDPKGEARLFAELTGIAVQLTNIIRDVAEDAAAGRVYLPMEDLAAFNLTRQDLRQMSKNLERLLAFEARRAHHFYDLGEAALPRSLRSRMYFAEALRDTYRALLSRIEADGFPVFERRVRLSAGSKVALAIRRRALSWLGW